MTDWYGAIFWYGSSAAPRLHDESMPMDSPYLEGHYVNSFPTIFPRRNCDGNLHYCTFDRVIAATSTSGHRSMASYNTQITLVYHEPTPRERVLHQLRPPEHSTSACPVAAASTSARCQPQAACRLTHIPSLLSIRSSLAVMLSRRSMIGFKYASNLLASSAHVSLSSVPPVSSKSPVIM